MDLLAPQKRDQSADQQLLDYLNQMRVDFNKLLDREIKVFIDNTVPYRAGQVLDVDMSYLGRKRRYYKEAKRFLIRGIEPYFWSQHDGRYHKLFVNLHGLFLAPDGELLLPEMLVGGIPSSLSPADIMLERIPLNVGGEVPGIIGVSADQHHNYKKLGDAIEAQEAKERERQNG